MEPENLECGRAKSLTYHSIAEAYMCVDRFAVLLDEVALVDSILGWMFVFSIPATALRIARCNPCPGSEFCRGDVMKMSSDAKVLTRRMRRM